MIMLLVQATELYDMCIHTMQAINAHTIQIQYIMLINSTWYIVKLIFIYIFDLIKTQKTQNLLQTNLLDVITLGELVGYEEGMFMFSLIISVD